MGDVSRDATIGYIDKKIQELETLLERGDLLGDTNIRYSIAQDTAILIEAKRIIGGRNKL